MQTVGLIQSGEVTRELGASELSLVQGVIRRGSS